MDKDLEYYKKNAEEDYLKVPISVLRYIGELEEVVKSCSTQSVSDCAFLVKFDGIGTITVLAKNKEDVKTKLEKEGFTKPFQILTAMSFIS